MADLILGLDPGSRFTGFGVIRVDGDRIEHVEHGVISLSGADSSLPERLKNLHVGLEAIFKRFAIHMAVVEKIFFGKNADSAFKLGHARGVCLLAAAVSGVPMEEYAAKFVKKCVTGSGAASKEHVQVIVMAALNLMPQVLKHDATDALALAVTYARMRDVKARVKRALENEL